MPDSDDQIESTTENFDGGENQQSAPEQEAAPSGNPAWEGIRSELDPISFSRIEDQLKQMDQAANTRVQSSNAEAAPWKTFKDAGYTPATMRTAMELQQRLDDNPAEVYEYLGKFLQQTGRMPTNAEVAKAEESGEIGEQGAVETPKADPRLDDLSAQQQYILEFLQDQQDTAQNAQLAARAESALDAEQTALQTAHPELTPSDLKEILGHAAAVAQQNFANGQEVIPTLEEAYGWYAGLRNRFLSSPRAGDSAPRLVPTSGGMPSGQQARLSDLSREQVQAIIAEGISQN